MLRRVVETAMPLLAAVERMLWGGGEVATVGVFEMLGGLDGAGVAGMASCSAVIGAEKMVAASKVVVEAAVERDVKGGGA